MRVFDPNANQCPKKALPQCHIQNEKDNENDNTMKKFQKLTKEDLYLPCIFPWKFYPAYKFYPQFMGVQEESVAHFITDQQRRQQKRENYITQLSQIGYKQKYLSRY